MPIYEYSCPGCELDFELLRPISKSGEKAECPRCDGNAEKKLSVFACFTADENGVTVPVGGSACAGCGLTDCGSCSL
jgi:putative FmdB family regulatory protein